jgi:serine-type D-Ala-D-Ala carboxypeptidase/endopeptidase (penicillin-binding protein 4)
VETANCSRGWRWRGPGLVVLPLLLAGCLAPRPVEPVAAERSARKVLAAELDAVFDDAKYANAFWGVRVETADGTVLYDRNGGKGFVPASNMKIFATAAALDLLGPEFTYETRLESVGTITSNGVLEGDLVIVGSGDPSLGAWHPDEERDSRVLLADWVAKVQAAGITAVTGSVLGDGRCFTAEYYCPSWMYGDLTYWYGAGSSGLAIEENAYRCVITPGAKVGDPATIRAAPETSYFRIINETRTVEAGGKDTADSTWQETEGNTKRFVGTIALDKEAIHERGSVWDGAGYAACLLHEALVRQGIAVRGAPLNMRTPGIAERVDGADPARRKVLAVTTSPPLRELVKVVNKGSHNFFADQILRTIGLQRAQEGSFAAGAKAVRDWLEAIGAPQPDAFKMHDGSGLARNSVVQPQQTCHVLRRIRGWTVGRTNEAGGKVLEASARTLPGPTSDTAPPRSSRIESGPCHPVSGTAGEAFLESLPIGGVDGTLRERLKDPATAGKVHAKTGYISGMRALSGYVTDAAGEELVFSMMCNQYTVPTSEVNAAQDAACKALAGYGNRP